MAVPAAIVEETFKIDKILIPYSYDVPNYNFYVTDNVGAIKGYTKYYNTGSSIFYGGNLTSLSLECDSIYDLVRNTRCSFTFVPKIRIEGNA